MTDLADAIRLLEAADWEAAHRIVQNDPSTLASWAHGIVHMMEGDLRNADYWYRRAGRNRPEVAQVTEEIAALRRACQAPE